MKIKTIEFNHGPVSIYAHSFESEDITIHVKEFLNTFQQFRSVTHKLTPGIGRVTICSTDQSVIPFKYSNKIGTLHLHFSNGRNSIDQDVILSLVHNPEKVIAINRLISAIGNLIKLTEPEFVSA
ncbi:hypothetical protein [Leptospira santarosai]|uniref:hypothetical protein n=1 Tax=Leptospira santarosai TaxID=28183 RepID=UPI0005198C5E|nr:hypothetical protein [Leptospira santarosai]AVV80965.1 Uncharacterized protein XB15_03226 [Leptospira santarosai]ONF83226.1 hypothetical protein BWD13_19050 [Leptospira santarosai serovar Grippotyphosa]